MSKEELGKGLNSVEIALGRDYFNYCSTILIHVEGVSFKIHIIAHTSRSKVRHLLDCDRLHDAVIGVVPLRLKVRISGVKFARYKVFVPDGVCHACKRLSQ